MASINLAGVLRDPTGEFSYKNRIRFTHNTTTGQTLKGFRSIHEIEIDGAYDIDLEYGNVLIETHDYLNKCWISNGVITINSDTPATDLPSLLGITTPATEADLLVFQALVEDANQSAIAASDSETAAGISETNAAFSASLAAQASYRTVPNVSLPLDSGALVEKLSGPLSFTRLSETGNINPSGVSETLGVDEPAITKDGLSIYSELTNEFLWNKFFTDPAWTTTNLTITQDGTLSPDLINQAYKITNDVLGAGTARLEQAVSSSGVRVLCKFKVKGAQGQTLKIESRATNSSVVEQIQHTLSGEWEDLSSLGGQDWSAQTDATVNCRLRLDSSNTAQDFYIAESLAAKTSNENLPYIETTTAAATRAPDIVSIPMMNNMPAAGQPFTIIADVDIPDDRGSVFSIDATAFTLWRYNTSGNVIVQGAPGTFVANIDSIGKKRYAVVFDGVLCSLYANGVFHGSGTHTPTYNLATSPFRLGQAKLSGGNLAKINSEIKNFQIFHSALSSEEIAARGGPDA